MLCANPHDRDLDAVRDWGPHRAARKFFSVGREGVLEPVYRVACRADRQCGAIMRLAKLL